MQPIIINSQDEFIIIKLDLPELNQYKIIDIQQLQATPQELEAMYYSKGGRRDTITTKKKFDHPGVEEISIYLKRNNFKSTNYHCQFRYHYKDELGVKQCKTHEIEVFVVDKVTLNIDPQAYVNPSKDEKRAKYHWQWGEKHKGAIILADLDNDRDDFCQNEENQESKQGKSELVKLTTSYCINYPNTLNTERYYKLALTTTANNALHFGLYTQPTASEPPKLILGSHSRHTPLNYISPETNEPKQVPEQRHTIDSGDNYTKQSGEVIVESRPLAPAGEDFFIRVNSLPNDFFEGIITITLNLIELPKHSYRDTKQSICQDHVILRVAPWMMMPNTQPMEKVFVSHLDSFGQVDKTEVAKKLSEKFNKELKVIIDQQLKPETEENPKELDEYFEEIKNEENRGDRWVQDEIEFGYCQGVTHQIKVVCDSPRDGKLDTFAKNQKQPDQGHFQIEGNHPNSLNSFGNLEVSPPVLPHYPFGRIIVGGSPTDGFGNSPRHMAHQLRGFLQAQKVQPPIEIFTDWLAVGHVDEIINFIPIPKAKPEDKIKFKMLIASPQLAIDLLFKSQYIEKTHLFFTPETISKNLQQGQSIDNNISFGQRVMHLDDDVQQYYLCKKRNLRKVLDHWMAKYWQVNKQCQEFLDWNRELLKKELGISEADIIEVPVLFKPINEKENARVISLLPNLVNQLVITTESRSFSIAPKCYGVFDTRGINQKKYKEITTLCQKLKNKKKEIDQINQEIDAKESDDEKMELNEKRKKLRDQKKKIKKAVPPKYEKIKYVFEEYLVSKMPEGHEVHFIDDWNLHFTGNGGVHCTTNVQRKPFDKNWWEYKPPHAHDI